VRPRSAQTYGFADRAHAVPNTAQAVFATASAAKSLTVVVVMSLVEHLLGHRSGIGDYLDEGSATSPTT